VRLSLPRLTKRPYRRDRDRRTCADCGQENVCHTRIGEPFEAHVRGKRHQAALEAWRQDYIAKMRKAETGEGQGA